MNDDLPPAARAAAHPRAAGGCRARAGGCLGRAVLFVVLFVAGAGGIAFPWCARRAGAWYRGDAELAQAGARGVSQWTHGGVGAQSFTTGSARFDYEWLFGTYMMGGMAFGQIAIEHPTLRSEMLPELEHAIEQLQTPEVRSFDRVAWGEDAFASLAGPHGHVAYLGYFNLVLGLHRLLEPESRFAPLHDQISSALARRFERSRVRLLETYPGEIYAVDNAAAISSVALHARLTGAHRGELVASWVARCRERWLDPDTGLLHQSWNGPADAPLDAPRGSGTALASYFLGFADPELSRELHAAVQRHLHRPLFRFGLVREYPWGTPGRGDIDSGPVVLGYSISASGFSLSGCRMHGARGCFRRTYAAFHLLGAPVTRGGRFTFVSGGPLADAIMLAMLTAPPPSLLEAAATRAAATRAAATREGPDEG